MRKAFITLCLILSAATARAASTPETSQLLEQILDVLRGVHTARYELTQKTFTTPDDSLYIVVDRYRIDECESPADTAGMANFVTHKPDGSFRNAYDGKRSIWERYGYLDISDLSKWHGVHTIAPPFFNHATRLCEYLSRPDVDKTVTVIDRDSIWEIDAVVREYQQIVFYGKPYIMPSLPYVTSHFTLSVDKETLMPSRLTFLSGWPQMRYECSVSDVALNPYPADQFSVEGMLPDLPRPATDEEKKEIMERFNARHHEKMETGLYPSDTLRMTDGKRVSLAQYKGKPLILLLTSTYCGYCRFAYPILNKLYDEYPADSIGMLGVILEDTAMPEAITRYAVEHEIRFPLAQNNGRFYQHFCPNGLAPVIIVADADGKPVLWQNSIDPENPDKIERRIRKAVEKAQRTE